MSIQPRRRSLAQLEKEVQELDPNLKKTDEAFKVSIILLAMLQGRTEAKDVKLFTGYSVTLINRVMKNLEKNDLGWRQNKHGRMVFRHSGWFDKKAGGAAFWLDVNVAMGYLGKSNGQSSDNS